MTQQVLSSSDEAPPGARRPSFRFPNPKWYLLMVVLSLFLAGILCESSPFMERAMGIEQKAH